MLLMIFFNSYSNFTFQHHQTRSSCTCPMDMSDLVTMLHNRSKLQYPSMIMICSPELAHDHSGMMHIPSAPKLRWDTDFCLQTKYHKRQLFC